MSAPRLAAPTRDREERGKPPRVLLQQIDAEQLDSARRRRVADCLSDGAPPVPAPNSQHTGNLVAI